VAKGAPESMVRKERRERLILIITFLLVVVDLHKVVREAIRKAAAPKRVKFSSEIQPCSSW
jgi:hypothetical protein